MIDNDLAIGNLRGEALAKCPLRRRFGSRHMTDENRLTEIRDEEHSKREELVQRTWNSRGGLLGEWKEGICVNIVGKVKVVRNEIRGRQSPKHVGFPCKS